ncbi:Clp protease ClpP [Mesorhizobium sp. M1148]|uniref:head maturation protease, ClpP-related n=1 Tax=unclassified Mesorhizobium TaxID=325217 RepID=UPI003335C2E1
MNVLIGSEIWLYGTVGEGVAMGVEGFTPINVRDALVKLGPTADVTVRINSGGGWCEDGVAIHSILAAHRGKVTVWIEGVAASAASILAMAGREIIIRPGAYMMIHEPAGVTFGTAADHAKTIESLRTINESTARIYADRTKRPLAEIKKELAAETWFTADEAVAKRFADKVVDGRATLPKASAFNWSVYSKAPAQLVALAGSVRNAAAFEAARERYATARKAATEEGVTAFLRQFCLGRERDEDVGETVRGFMASQKNQHPEAYALALKLGRTAPIQGREPQQEINARHSVNVWEPAIDRANKRWNRTT